VRASCSNNQQVAHRLRDGVCAIAGFELCLRFFQVAADRFFTKAE